MTTVLVTGGNGLLGSTLVPLLQLRGHEVKTHARAGRADYQSDLADPKDAFKLLNQIKPEVIANLVGLTDVDLCEAKPNSAYMANVRAVENIAGWIKKSKTSCHLVQISTDQVYDGPGPHQEGDITLSNYYGFSKYAGELTAATVPSTILRTNFFGPSQCSGRVSLSDWLLESLKQRTPITVFEDIRFSPLSLQRLVELLELVIERRPQGIFNLGSRQGMSKADFAFALANTMGLPTESMTRGVSIQGNLKAYRPKDMCMDSSRFEDFFGVQLPTLQEEIQSMKAAYVDEAR